MSMYLIPYTEKCIMNKIIYVIPGWEECCGDPQYQRLASMAKERGYDVRLHDVDWTQPLSSQVFSVPPEAIVFGFSLGAILACLVAQQYPCQHLILASMTPRESFTDPKVKKSLIDLAGQAFVDDIISTLRPTHQAKIQTTLYGDQEDTAADILVPNTEHEINAAYIAEIKKLL